MASLNLTAEQKTKMDGAMAEHTKAGCSEATEAKFMKDAEGILTPEQYGERVRERVGDTPVFMSFDVDFLDPAFAPGTGTPEIAGFSTAEAVAFVRALRGINLVACDVVEVSPSYDGPGQQTALAAANVMWELLALHALAR